MECDIPEFYSVTEPIARKAHRCAECGARIQKGEKYLAASGKWEGEIKQFRQHLLCAEACMFIRDHIEEDCIGFGTLLDWVSGNTDAYNKKNNYIKKLRDLVSKIRRRERSEA